MAWGRISGESLKRGLTREIAKLLSEKVAGGRMVQLMVMCERIDHREMLGRGEMELAQEPNDQLLLCH